VATKTTTLTLRLGPKLREELERAAYYQEMTLGEFVRYAVSQYLRLQKEEGA
jgi:uncharacterized protein (DUF1778 family)